METPEQRAERIFKEDDEKKERDNQQELLLRQQKRQAVVEKHLAWLREMVFTRKGRAFRKFFLGFVSVVACAHFQTEEEEYKHIGKVGRKKWSSYDWHLKTFTKDELEVVGEIMREFGAYDY